MARTRKKACAKKASEQCRAACKGRGRGYDRDVRPVDSMPPPPPKPNKPMKDDDDKTC